MPTKNSVVSNVFEQMTDTTKASLKSAAKQVVDLVDPAKIIEQIVSPGTALNNEQNPVEKIKQETEKKQSSTPLNFENLNKKYQENDAVKLMQWRKQLNSVKEGEKNAINELEKEREDRMRKIAQEEQEKKRIEAEQQNANTSTSMPQGKQKRGMMAPKKKAQQQHQETKPSVGKQ